MGLWQRAVTNPQQDATRAAVEFTPVMAKFELQDTYAGDAMGRGDTQARYRQWYGGLQYLAGG